jgi:hypothetical protein
VPVLWTELVFKVSTPYTFSTSPITERISRLEHELLDDSVKENVVVVAILNMRDEILDRFWRSIGE